MFARSQHHTTDNNTNSPRLPACPACGGTVAALGMLSCLDWFRCIQCGMDVSRRQRFFAEDRPDEDGIVGGLTEGC